MSSFPKVKYYSDHSCQNLPYSLDVDLGIKGYTIWGYYKRFESLLCKRVSGVKNYDCIAESIF